MSTQPPSTPPQIHHLQLHVPTDMIDAGTWTQLIPLIIQMIQMLAGIFGKGGSNVQANQSVPSGASPSQP